MQGISLQSLQKGKLLSYWDQLSVKFDVPPLNVRTNFFRLLAVSQTV